MPKQIVIPQGMKDAIYWIGGEDRDSILEAALLWLSDNPIAPGHNVIEKILSEWCGEPPYTSRVMYAVVEWQRRMFLAPELKFPAEIEDMLWLEGSKASHLLTASYLNFKILEAFRRGKASK